MNTTAVGFKLLIFLIFYCVMLFFLMILATAFVIAVIFFCKKGTFNFSWGADVFYSIRMGLAAGAPTGIGIWVLSKMEEIKRKKAQEDKEE